MPPVNDDIVNATIITGTSGSIAGTLTGATTEVDEPNTTGTINGWLQNRSVWYGYSSQTTGMLVIWLVANTTSAMHGRTYVVKPPTGGTGTLTPEFGLLVDRANSSFAHPTADLTYSGGGPVSKNYPLYLQVVGGVDIDFTLHWQFVPASDLSWIGPIPDMDTLAPNGYMPGMVFTLFEEWDSFAGVCYRYYLIGWSPASGPYFYAHLSDGYFPALGWGTEGADTGSLCALPPLEPTGDELSFNPFTGPAPVWITSTYGSQRGSAGSGVFYPDSGSYSDLRLIGHQASPITAINSTFQAATGWLPGSGGGQVAPATCSNGGRYYAFMGPVNGDIPSPFDQSLVLGEFDLRWRLLRTHEELPVTPTSRADFLLIRPSSVLLYYFYSDWNPFPAPQGWTIGIYNVANRTQTTVNLLPPTVAGQTAELDFLGAITPAGTYMTVLGINSFRTGLSDWVIAEYDPASSASGPINVWTFANTHFARGIAPSSNGGTIGFDGDPDYVWLAEYYHQAGNFNNLVCDFYRINLRQPFPATFTPTFTLDDPYVNGSQVAGTRANFVDFRYVGCVAMAPTYLANAVVTDTVQPRGVASTFSPTQRATRWSARVS